MYTIAAGKARMAARTRHLAWATATSLGQANRAAL